MLGAAFAAAMLSGCSDDGASPRGERTSTAHGRAPAAPIDYTLETVVDGLDLPWSLAFLPDGSMLLTERPGAVKHVTAAGEVSKIFDFADLKDAPVHFVRPGQAGLFEVSLHPDFADNRLVYFTYAGKTGGEKSTLMLMRFQLEGDAPQLRLTGGWRLFAATPDRVQFNHYGGRIAWMADGTLLLPHGEAFHFREKAQLLDNHFGKLLRLKDDGSVPPDNPFVGKDGALPEIYSYGHRNQQGILIGTDGAIYLHEHGPKGGDEINRIEKGANYGWPVVSYGLDYSGARISPFEALPNTKQPLLHFTPSIAPSGFTQYSGEAFPGWKDDLFLSALALKHVRRVEVTEDGGFGAQQELFGELGARIRDVRTGPDGFLYLLTETREGAGGKLIRVKPKE